MRPAKAARLGDPDRWIQHMTPRRGGRMTTEPTDLREKIARAIHDGPNAQAQYRKNGIPAHGYSECIWKREYLRDADAVLPIVREAQAGALRDAAEWMNDYVDAMGLVKIAEKIEESTDDES